MLASHARTRAQEKTVRKFFTRRMLQISCFLLVLDDIIFGVCVLNLLLVFAYLCVTLVGATDLRSEQFSFILFLRGKEVCQSCLILVWEIYYRLLFNLNFSRRRMILVQNVFVNNFLVWVYSDFILVLSFADSKTWCVMRLLVKVLLP